MDWRFSLTTFRRLIGLISFVLGIILLTRLQFTAAIPIGLLGIGCLAPEFVHIISYPVHRFFSGLFFPGEAGTPPPDYNRCQVYRDQGRYEEALEVYDTILKNHPEELLAYIQGIETAYLNGTPEKAQSYLSTARRKLKEAIPLQQVERAFLQTLEPAPEATHEDESELPPWRRTGEVEASAPDPDLPPWRQPGNGGTTPPPPPTAESEEDLPPWRR